MAFEYRGKVDDPRWRAGWDQAIFWGSALPALLWGVAFANIVHGVPIDKNHEYTGSLLTLLNPYGLLGGLVTLGLFTLHGAYYLALKTEGDVRDRANALAGQIAPVVVVLGAVFLIWTQVSSGRVLSWIVTLLAAVVLVASVLANRVRREGWAFALMAGCLALVVVALFATLYPNVMPSSTDAAYNLTTTNASSTHYTLTVMTWVAVLLTPFVLLYQGWTYWVFRARVTPGRIPVLQLPGRPPAATPTAAGPPGA